MRMRIAVWSWMVMLCAAALAQDPASEATKAVLEGVRAALPFEDRSDFDDARRGFLGTLEDAEIRNADGVPVYSMQQFEFLEADAPDTVNPSLWRQSQLNQIHGLFEVVDGIYQVRGFDLSNMTVIRGDTGWIVIDPLTSVETAAAAMGLVREKLGERPIKAVLFTHSHVDHFGGVRALLTDEDLSSGRVMLIGPDGFYRSAVDENILAGNAMVRRASYMFGNLLPKSAEGTVGAGLGQTTPSGTLSLMEPTRTVTETGERLTVDGIELVFQNTPGAEAPAELMFYLPQFKALCQAEEINHTLHNLYTLRGAHVRSGLLWSKYINEAIGLFGGEVEVSFGSHHWPTWGNERVVEFMKKQRDLYRYIHDETLRLANWGYTMDEIAEMIELPESLARFFANRDYYGTLSHNAKAQYQLYFGWFDGNPANLNPLPPVEESVKYVEYMGGADAVITRAQADLDKGEYRFVATALNHVVFADPENAAAKELLAKAYVQMGYQAESGPWRNFYLSGARELRQGVPKVAGARTLNLEVMRAVSLESMYDLLAVVLNHPKAAGKQYTINFIYPDTGQESVIYIENGVQNYAIGRRETAADATVTIPRVVLNQLLLGQANLGPLMAEKTITIEGNQAAVLDYLAMLDRYEFWFNIVTP